MSEALEGMARAIAPEAFRKIEERERGSYTETELRRRQQDARTDALAALDYLIWLAEKDRESLLTWIKDRHTGFRSQARIDRECSAKHAIEWLRSLKESPHAEG
jgi:hypothetical protein